MLLKIITRDIGQLDKAFNLVAAGYKSRFIHNVYIKYLKPELYYLQKITGDPYLKEYLKHLENAGFSYIEDNLPAILNNISDKLKSTPLSLSINTWINSIKKYDEFIDRLYADEDDTPVVRPIRQPDNIASQNVASEQVVNHILSNLNPKLAR